VTRPKGAVDKDREMPPEFIMILCSRAGTHYWSFDYFEELRGNLPLIQKTL
jgi:hypothetical protein